MIIYYAPIAFTATQTVGSSQAGYGPENLQNTAIRLPWIGVGTALQTLQIDLGTAQPIAGIYVYGMNSSVRRGTLALRLESDDIGALTVVRTKYGFSKAQYAPVSQGYGGDYRYVYLDVTPEPGGDAPSIYVVYVFALEDTIRNPAYGMTIDHVEPHYVTTLANGARPAAITGPAYDVLSMQWDTVRARGDDPETLARVLTLGPAGIDLENEIWQWWPVVREEYTDSMTLPNAALEQPTLRVRELVTA